VVALFHRLKLNDQERSMMLAGMAHDLKSPLSRLRLRLEDGGVSLADDRRLAQGDLFTLERITDQFLVFAGGGDAERAVQVNLEELLAEMTASIEGDELVLDLECLERRVQPTSLARAVGNLIDNALSYGRLPLRLVLRSDQPAGQGFRIEVWDHGEGIAPEAWEQVLKPFSRLDQSRSGQGHCGLGLAIALRVAGAHGGCLEATRSEEGFAVVLRGRSI
jgi:two-component system osmolarity sensor histidine kinase EnvZ